MAYVITGFNGGDLVSVIDTATGAVVASIGGFATPWGVAVSPDGTAVYVTNLGLDSGPRIPSILIR